MNLLTARRWACILLQAFLTVICATSTVSAHLMPAQQGTLNLVDNAVFAAVAVPLSALQNVDDDHDGRLSDAEFRAHSAAMKASITPRLRLFDGDQAGRLDMLQVLFEPDERVTAASNHAAPAAPTSPQSSTQATPPTNPQASTPTSDKGNAGTSHFLVLMKASFSAPPQALRIETDLFGGSAAEQQLTLKTTRGKEVEVAILSPSHSVHRFFRAPAWVLLDYLVVGIEHILLGADHLLFLLTVIVAGAGWRYWLGVLTSFTLAHSITLTLGLLGWVHVAPTLVEPLIAASIMLMAALNLRQHAPAPLRRIAIVFACGLLHGLGFASAMGDMGLHGVYKFTSIVGFNVGIELGQAVFLLAVLGLGWLLRQVPRPAVLAEWGGTVTGVQALSWAALVLGAYWMWERVGWWG